uniref:Uncharacterized protein n=1 Tax=Rhizophora mucronata TaxID=61149 RepID=A0A2P2PLP6_RHIMU
MADRVYPSNRPTATTNGAATATTTAPAFPATKAQLYGATRPPYRPQTNRYRKRSRRGCFCFCCLWTTIIILSLLFLAGIAGTVFYILYRPHRPSFSVTGLKIASLNLTKTSRVTTKIKLNITTTNPNKKLIFIYNPTTISATTATDNIELGQTTIPSFVHGKKNTTLLISTITSSGQPLDDASASKLKTDLKSKNGVNLKINLNTKLEIKAGGLKTPKTRIRVSCEGIKANVPTGKKATTASVSNAKCKFDLRIKIWRWTF